MNRTARALACLSIAGLAGCPTMDLTEPIALVPAEDWTELEARILQNAGGCWNLRFGTQFRPGSAEETGQWVDVFYSDLVCVYAAGRAEQTIGGRIAVCPPRYGVRGHEDQQSLLFRVLVHELGHIANIRDHAGDPEAVMEAGRGQFPARFTAEDERLFLKANPGFAGAPTCPEVSLDYGAPPACRCDGG
jgi:hypothetical protein